MKKLLQLLAFLLLSTYLCAQPIRLHPENPHYFIFRENPTVIISSGEHYGAVINPSFDFLKYLNTLQKEGMNYTRLFSGTYFEKEGSFGIEKNTLSPPHGKALLPWKRSNEPGAICGGNKLDLDRWDENYFTRLKSFVLEASKRGIIVEFSLFSSIYNYWDNQPWNPANNITLKGNLLQKDVQTLNNGIVLKYQENVVRKIIRELNEFDNVIYEIQNEPWSDHILPAEQKSEYFTRQDFAQDGTEWRNMVELADQLSLDWQKKIAFVISDEEKKLPKKHIIAQNYCNFYFPVTQVDSNVSILNFHYAYPVVIEQNYAYNKVVGFDETGFAGSADVTYRKQAWNFVIAGGALFNNLDYSFTVGKEDGTEINKAPGGGSTELRKQLKVLSDFIHSFDFIKMKPDYNSLVQAPGSFARILSEPGKQYAVYINNGSKYDLTLNLPKGEYKCEWINTITGNTEKSEMMKHNGGDITLIKPEYSVDIALKINVQ